MFGWVFFPLLLAYLDIRITRILLVTVITQLMSGPVFLGFVETLWYTLVSPVISVQHNMQPVCRAILLLVPPAFSAPCCLRHFHIQLRRTGTNFASVYSDTCWPFHNSIRWASKCSLTQAPVKKGERMNTSCPAVKSEAWVSSSWFVFFCYNVKNPWIWTKKIKRLA